MVLSTLFPQELRVIITMKNNKNLKVIFNDIRSEERRVGKECER